ncbi:MAG TPA: SPOR domain-containing protein [Vicinamibacterales bacterium]|nr:SPOR domain-containing protein [Vicinamibacterales bacterium]
MRGSAIPACSAAVILAASATAAAQQGSLQISTDTQIVQGHPQRRLAERRLEPDFGALWTQPGRRFGQLQLELRASRRGDDLHLGRSWFALRDARARGVAWTFEGGDLYTPPSLVDYHFTNLAAPAITFTGGAVSGRSKTLSLQIAGGRSTAWRNIFGTDPDALGQTVGLARLAYQATPRVQLLARGSRVRTRDLGEFPRTIDASDQAGGGVRFVVTPSFHLIGDAGYVRYRATGAAAAVHDYSYLAGAHVLIARGWVQVNASRYSPGDLPVLNASLHDRSGIFSAGEYELFDRVRVFGGWEQLDTNIAPTGTALDRPIAETQRHFGGIRLRIAGRSLLSLRIEDGGRVARPPIPQSPASLFASTSDTGSRTAELQTGIGPLTAFARYSRRESVDSVFTASTYDQEDTTGQFFLNLTRETQLFGLAMLSRNRLATGGGGSYVQFTAGGQQQLFRPGLWVRVEGTTSRNREFTTGMLVPREAVSVGLNGQLTTQTTIGLNVYADRAPIGLPGESNAWLTRSTLRVVHSIATGAVRVASESGTMARAGRGTGTVSGSVFADWNANGQPDPGENVLAGIPVLLGTLSAVTTGRDGQFTFLNVPSGAHQVRLDLNALPVDFDAPAGTDVALEVSRGESRRVAFGLLPLGAIRGYVFEDANRNGQIDAGDPSVDNAVLVLDGGQRSELVRKGQFRFDAVRAGEHRIELLKESLPEGSAIVGANGRTLEVTRDTPQVDIVFLVTIEKRPEVRKVFPSRPGNTPPPASAAAARSPAPLPGAARPVGSRAPAASALPSFAIYTIQVAAMSDAANARELLQELKRVGFEAYLVEPAGGMADALYRVRVGKYESRTSAQRVVSRLESQLGLKMWITRAR